MGPDDKRTECCAVEVLRQMAVVAPEARIFDGIGEIRLCGGAYGLGPRFAGAFQGENTEGGDEGRSFEMPRYVRIGYVEPDAVPGPVFVDRGFQEFETAADAVSACSYECCGGSSAPWGSCLLRRGSAKRRRGVVERLAKKLERCCAGSCRLPLFLTEFAARRKHQMRHGIGFLVHVNRVVFVQRYAELPFDRFFGSGEKTRAKIGIFSCFRQEQVFCPNAFSHCCSPFSRVLIGREYPAEKRAQAR